MHASLTLGWFYLPAAFMLGAFHALEPGHGKSLASAYLVSGRHTWWDAVVLGLATTFSHTAVIVALAAAGLELKTLLPQDRLERGIGLVGAWILIGLGAWTVARAYRAQTTEAGVHRRGHDHAHGHSHPPQASGQGSHLWGVALIGLGNGLLPCPGALAALLAALSMGRPGLGLVTVLTYSLGLAAALAAVGIVVVEAGRRAKALLPSDRAVRWLPMGSGIVVLGMGVWLLATR